MGESTVEFVAITKVIWPIIMAYGPSSIGWVVAGLLFWHILNRRKEVAEAVFDANQKLLDAKDKYLIEIQEMNVRLESLNQKHLSIVSELNDARVEDLKDLTADYNKLASETLRTMDRFVIALETSNNIKQRKLGGD